MLINTYIVFKLEVISSATSQSLDLPEVVLSVFGVIHLKLSLSLDLLNRICTFNKDLPVAFAR